MQRNLSARSFEGEEYERMKGSRPDYKILQACVVSNYHGGVWWEECGIVAIRAWLNKVPFKDTVSVTSVRVRRNLGA